MIVCSSSALDGIATHRIRLICPPLSLPKLLSQIGFKLVSDHYAKSKFNVEIMSEERRKRIMENAKKQLLQAEAEGAGEEALEEVEEDMEDEEEEVPIDGDCFTFR